MYNFLQILMHLFSLFAEINIIICVMTQKGSVKLSHIHPFGSKTLVQKCNFSQFAHPIFAHICIRC